MVIVVTSKTWEPNFVSFIIDIIRNERMWELLIKTVPGVESVYQREQNCNHQGGTSFHIITNKFRNFFFPVNFI